MFTGLIEHSGTVAAIERDADGAVVTIDTALAANLKPGGSIAVNGVCLTATRPSATAFSADVMNESLSRTVLGALGTGDRVNLELPLAVGDRLDGHVVQGHVDGVGEIAGIRDDGVSSVLRVSLPGGIARYVVEKGSITLDGVSLTVSGVGDDWLEVSLIPETKERTTLGVKAPGDRVNVEVDVFAKYVERLTDYLSGPGSGPDDESTNG